MSNLATFDSMMAGFLWAYSHTSGSRCAVDTNKTFLFGFGQYGTIITGL